MGQWKDESKPKTTNAYGTNVKTVDNLEQTSGQFKHESFDNYLKEMRKKCDPRCKQSENVKC